MCLRNRSGFGEEMVGTVLFPVSWGDCLINCLPHLNNNDIICSYIGDGRILCKHLTLSWLGWDLTLQSVHAYLSLLKPLHHSFLLSYLICLLKYYVISHSSSNDISTMKFPMILFTRSPHHKSGNLLPLFYLCFVYLV